MSKWVNLDDLLKLRQNVRLLDEGGWDEDIKAVPIEAIKGLAKLDIVRCKDCKFYSANIAPSVYSLAFKHHCCRNFYSCDTKESDFCSYGVRKE